jgi:hypothetical protein
MSEKKRKVIDIVTRVLMWVSMLGALFSAVATQLADAGLELPAVVSGVVSVVVLVGRFARNLAPKLPELLLILGLSGVAVAGSGIIDGQDLENIPQSKHDQLIEYIDTLDAVENEADTEATEPDPDPDLGPADYLGIILGMFAPVGCAPAQQAVIKETLTDYGTRLGLCLAKAGLAWLGDLVYSRGQGEILDLSEVPGELHGAVKSCAWQLGGYILTDIFTGPLPDSVGATMPYASKALMLLDNQDEVCGDVCLVYVP